jgi:mevalonate kinase
LGSSAAFNTVLATVLLIIFKQLDDGKGLDFTAKEKINELSFEFESVEHGNPSGIDNFVSIHGGLILFNKKKEPKFECLG